MGRESSEELVRVGDGHEIFVRLYEPDDDAARTIAIIHGAGEHGGRYEHIKPQCLARGWRVLAADLRGHGLSGGVPTHIDAFNDYLADLDLLYERFSLNPERTAVLAHSMGGLIAARFLQTRPTRAAAAVLASPLLGLQHRVSPIKRALGRVCFALAPETRFRTAIQPSQITRSEEVLDRRRSDPLANPTVTAGWYFRMLDAVGDAWAQAADFQTPLLLLQGEADRIVRPAAAIQWWHAVGARDKSLRVLAGHLHELLNEPSWEQTLDGILDWLEVRLPRRKIRLPAATAAAHAG